MLTPVDFENLLKLISSPRLQINGAEAQVVAMLQFKLQQALKDAAQPQCPNEDLDGDNSGPAAQGSGGAAEAAS